MTAWQKQATGTKTRTISGMPARCLNWKTGRDLTRSPAGALNPNRLRPQCGLLHRAAKKSSSSFRHLIWTRSHRARAPPGV